MTATPKSALLGAICGAFAFVAMGGAAWAGPTSATDPNTLGASASLTTKVGHMGGHHKKKFHKRHHKEYRSY